MTAPGASGGTGYLGSRGASLVELSADNKNVPGGWVATFRAQDLYADDFEVYHIAVKGPNGNFDVYVGDLFYSAAVRSDRNEYDPKNAMYVRRGQDISFHFSSAAAPQPEVVIYTRQPQQGFF